MPPGCAAVSLLTTREIKEQAGNSNGITGLFRGTPERISPLGDKPRIRGAQQKNLPHGRFFRGTPERIRTAGLQSRSLSLYPAELRAHIQQEIL